MPYWRHIENHVAAHAVHLERSLENPDGNEQDVLEDFHAQVRVLTYTRFSVVHDICTVDCRNSRLQRRKKLKS